MLSTFKQPQHVLMIIPDGVSLRNFVYSSFLNQCHQSQIQVSILNLSGFDLDLKGVTVQTIRQKRLHFLTTILKNVRKQLELKHFEQQFNNPIYRRYLFKYDVKDLKSFIRMVLAKAFYVCFLTFGNIYKLRCFINFLERQTRYFNGCKGIIKALQPDVVFNCSQRSVTAIAPIQAAKQLGILSIGFIYSWDNLPKATLDVETDHYHVWSDHMKVELLRYHSFIKPVQIIVTGTPQFEMHFDKHLKQERSAFLNTFGLDPAKKYICFSGDDVTTSPHDPRYLADVAAVVRELNRVKDKWRIIFRRCPVDFSNRYDAVLQEYQNEITPIAPQWERLANSWDAVLPLKDDNALLVNTVAHCELVINLGSSMVFDAVCHGTPCAYIAYNPEDVPLQKDIKTIYQYIHFQSMPNEKPVFWLRNQLELKSVLKQLETEKETILKSAKKWFAAIHQHPPAQSSQRIIDQLKQLS